MSVYLVSICEITSFSEALSEYADVSAKLIEKNGGHYVVRGPVNKVVEGALLNGKTAIIAKFPNKECIHNFWASEEYQSIKHKREGTGIYDIGIFEGVD